MVSVVPAFICDLMLLLHLVLLRVMFLQPSRDIAVLNSRLDVVQFCVEPKNEELVKNMLVCLQNIKSITVRHLYHLFVATV
jgi:DNA mismatch repair ATPase MutS